MINEGDLITFKTNSFQNSKIYTGIVEYKEHLGLVVFADGIQHELRKILNIRTVNTSKSQNEADQLF